MRPVQRPLNILIVDDSAMVRAMLKRVIQLSAVPIALILEASDGKKALDILESQPIDAIFTGMNMPEMNGRELLREIDGRSAWNHILRVVISPDGSAAWRIKLGALNVRYSVEKPFRPEMVRDILLEFTGPR